MANKAIDKVAVTSYDNTDNTFFEWKRPKPRERGKRAYFEPTSFSSIQDTVLKNKGLDDLRQKLFMLYEHWDMVLGDDLASLALPIGHRNKIFLIAAEDSMALNELSYSQEEILDRIQAFMGERFFNKLELHLLQGKKPLNQINKAEHIFAKAEIIRPENLGKLNLPEGKVKDAYLHYLSLFEN